MGTERDNSLVDYFAYLKDPRVDRTKKHKFIVLIIISICAESLLEFMSRDKKSFLKCHTKFIHTIGWKEFLREKIGRNFKTFFPIGLKNSCIHVCK